MYLVHGFSCNTSMEYCYTWIMYSHANVLFELEVHIILLVIVFTLLETLKKTRLLTNYKLSVDIGSICQYCESESNILGLSTNRSHFSKEILVRHLVQSHSLNLLLHQDRRKTRHIKRLYAFGSMLGCQSFVYRQQKRYLQHIKLFEQRLFGLCPSSKTWKFFYLDVSSYKMFLTTNDLRNKVKRI